MLKNHWNLVLKSVQEVRKKMNPENKLFRDALHHTIIKNIKAAEQLARGGEKVVKKTFNCFFKSGLVQTLNGKHYLLVTEKGEWEHLSEEMRKQLMEHCLFSMTKSMMLPATYLLIFPAHRVIVGNFTTDILIFYRALVLG
jgi:hypothetical protein